MKIKIKGIVTQVSKSKKSNTQYINLFDLETATSYTLVSRDLDYSDLPVTVPVNIDAEVAPRVFSNEGKQSLVLYIKQASFKVA